MSTPQDRHRSINAATSKLAAEIELDLLRKVIREELDRKPDGWMEYAEACVAWFDYQYKPTPDWNIKRATQLEMAAVEAGMKYHAQHPS